MSKSIERTQLTVDSSTYALGPLENLDDLRSQVLRAARGGGGFLIVTVDEGQRLSFFVTAATSIVITVTTVPLSARTADGELPAHVVENAQDYGDGDVPWDLI